MKRSKFIMLESVRIRHNNRLWLIAWNQGLCLKFTNSMWFIFTGEKTIAGVTIDLSNFTDGTLP